MFWRKEMSIIIPADKAHLVADTMSEAQLQQHVKRLCRDLELLYYHTHDSRRSEAGFPDCVIAGKRIIFRELKSQSGRMSLAQITTEHRLIAAGGNYKIWRPMHLVSGQIEIELRELA